MYNGKEKTKKEKETILNMTHTCTECGFEAKSPQALGSHSAYKHKGVKLSKRHIESNTENGKKTYIASQTLTTQLQRKMLVEWIQPELEEIFNALAAKAKKGNVSAARELFNRTWGKAPQPLWHGDNEGNQIVFVPQQIGDKHNIQYAGVDSSPSSDSQ